MRLLSLSPCTRTVFLSNRAPFIIIIITPSLNNSSRRIRIERREFLGKDLLEERVSEKSKDPWDWWKRGRGEVYLNARVKPETG